MPEPAPARTSVARKKRKSKHPLIGQVVEVETLDRGRRFGRVRRITPGAMFTLQLVGGGLATDRYRGPKISKLPLSAIRGVQWRGRLRTLEDFLTRAGKGGAKP